MNILQTRVLIGQHAKRKTHYKNKLTMNKPQYPGESTTYLYKVSFMRIKHVLLL